MKDTYSNIEKKTTFNDWKYLPPIIKFTEYKAYFKDKEIPIKSTHIPVQGTDQFSLFKFTNIYELKASEATKDFRNTNKFNFEQINGSICSVINTPNGKRVVFPSIPGEESRIQLIVHEIQEYSNKVNIFPQGQNIKIEEIIIGLEQDKIKYVKKIISPFALDKIISTFYFENDEPYKYETKKMIDGELKSFVIPELINGKYIVKSDEKRWNEDKFVGEHIIRYFKGFSEKNPDIKESMDKCLEYLKIEDKKTKTQIFEV